VPRILSRAVKYEIVRPGASCLGLGQFRVAGAYLREDNNALSASAKVIRHAAGIIFVRF
jgi:hypothetical protein